ncbi:MAG: hypothetical protein LBV03_09935 [Fusobacteriales bacterium]|nr:hypothetical protein [Fusobacteriales bacterium]
MKRPVTVTAEAAGNRISVIESFLPGKLDTGRLSNIVSIIIVERNESIATEYGDILFSFLTLNFLRH